MATLDDVGPTLPRIARDAIESFVVGKREIELGHMGAPRAPVFVTLRRWDGSLRGCIGSILPVERDVVAETARSAVLAATRDPRFSPLVPAELGEIAVEVSVLMPDEPLVDLTGLDPIRYGIIVRDGLGRQGLLLPDVPGIHDAQTQVAIARSKAGLAPGASVLISRFEVRKWAGVL